VRILQAAQLASTRAARNSSRQKPGILSRFATIIDVQVSLL
jgi:hypothetical protein